MQPRRGGGQPTTPFGLPLTEWLVDSRLPQWPDCPQIEGLQSGMRDQVPLQPYAIWVPDVLRLGPALVFAGAADWWPAAAYLPSLEETLEVRLVLEQRVGHRGPMARRLVLVSEASHGIQRVGTASLLRGVDSLSGWGLPSDLGPDFPASPDTGGPVTLRVSATPGARPTTLAGVHRACPCGGLIVHGDGAKDAQMLVLWRDETGLRGWTQVERGRPLDPGRTVSHGGRVYGPDSRGWEHDGDLRIEGDNCQARLWIYENVAVIAEWAIPLLQDHLVFGPLRGL
jgi:hypothetical protein